MAKNEDMGFQAAGVGDSDNTLSLDLDLGGEGVANESQAETQELSQEEREIKSHKEEIERLQAELGEKSSKRVEVLVMLVLGSVITIFVFIACISGARESKESVKQADLPYTVLKNDSFAGDETLYADVIGTVKKFATIQDGSIMFFIEGSPKNFGKKVVFQVTPNIYNAIDSSRHQVSITYKVLTLNINGEVRDFLQDVKVTTVTTKG